MKALKRSKPSQQLCHGTSRGPTNCFCWKLPSGSVSVGFEAAIWHLRRATTCFYWASKLPSGTFPAALKPLKPSQQLCHGTFRGPTTCFCWKLPSGSVSVGLRSCYLAFPRRHNLFLLASKLPFGTFPAALKTLKTLPAALPWDMSTNGVQHRLARGRGKENSAKRRRVNLTFPIPGGKHRKASHF